MHVVVTEDVLEDGIPIVIESTSGRRKLPSKIDISMVKLAYYEVQ